MGRKACMRKGWIGFAENMLKKVNNGGSKKKMFVLTLRSGKIKKGRGEVFYFYFFFHLSRRVACLFLCLFLFYSVTNTLLYVFLCIFVPSNAPPLTDVFPLTINVFLHLISNSQPPFHDHESLSLSLYSTPLKSCFFFL